MLMLLGACLKLNPDSSALQWREQVSVIQMETTVASEQLESINDKN